MKNQNEAGFPQPINTEPDDILLYKGLARQNLDFHQCLGELIDNAISAQSGEYFTVEILIQKEGDDLHLTVADDEKGISLEDLTQRVLRLGGKGTELGVLNEHGFGLKNSLCTLTGNERPFHILTRDERASQLNHYYIAHGPFSRNMQAELDTESNWLKDLTKCRGDTGTRVYAQTTFSYFRSLYPRGNYLETLIERLMEHLGVKYRGYLKDPRNTIWIRWRDGTSDWQDESIKTIEIPFSASHSKRFDVRVGNNTEQAWYTWGTLDESVIEDGSSGKPFPLKMYYQKNLRTQGIDIRVRNRVILPHQMTEIWPEVYRHNDHNPFIGELIIESAKFVTVNNKTSLAADNVYWQKLKEMLDHKDYKPASHRKLRSEDEIKKELKERLEEIVPGSDAITEYSTWPGAGIRIDILHRIAPDREHVYEVKAGQSTAKDVYQLVMYWDGRVNDGHAPELGRLVAKGSTTSVTQMIDYWNKRKDANGKNYKLEFKTISALLGE
ncbi:MAG: sensor histidine kinase [Dehalococcoidia bacterium]|nr:sensor histidine kinase [Chloroflexota bacterium]MCK4242823.1 sensor histidine kinase [Dehalococcoidia bacterium]